MKKIIDSFLLMVFSISFIIILGANAQARQAREVFFHVSSKEKADGRWYGVSISCYQPEGEDAPSWEYLITGYHGHDDPGSTRPDINKYVESLPELPTSSCTEWEVLSGTWRNFWAPPKSILFYLPAILAAGRQEYFLDRTDKVRKGAFSASITCRGGRTWRQGLGWGGAPVPTPEAQPLVFQTLAKFEMPEDRSCSPEQEWKTYKGQWVWFKRDGTPLYP